VIRTCVDCGRQIMTDTLVTKWHGLFRCCDYYASLGAVLSCAKKDTNAHTVEREKDSAAVKLGRRGGTSTSEDKANAARENIQKAIAARWKGHTKKRKGKK
jgi:hypothetical protein